MGKPDEPDLNQEAVRQVNELTDSEPVNGEDLVSSEELKQKFREAKKRIESSKKSRR